MSVLKTILNSETAKKM